VKAPFVAGAMLAALGAQPARAQTPPPDGQALYRQYCRTCHGVTGKPTDFALRTYGKIPALSDSAFIASHSQDSIVAIITHGVGDGTNMWAFKNLLTPDQIVAVARYVRTLPAQVPGSP